LILISQLPRSEIMKQIGNLFILRININLVGSILDSPVCTPQPPFPPPCTPVLSLPVHVPHTGSRGCVPKGRVRARARVSERKLTGAGILLDIPRSRTPLFGSPIVSRNITADRPPQCPRGRNTRHVEAAEGECE
jgi:hypothetical protein